MTNEKKEETTTVNWGDGTPIKITPPNWDHMEKGNPGPCRGDPCDKSAYDKEPDPDANKKA